MLTVFQRESTQLIKNKTGNVDDFRSEHKRCALLRGLYSTPVPARLSSYRPSPFSWYRCTADGLIESCHRKDGVKKCPIWGKASSKCIFNEMIEFHLTCCCIMMASDLHFVSRSPNPAIHSLHQRHHPGSLGGCHQPGPEQWSHKTFE